MRERPARQHALHQTASINFHGRGPPYLSAAVFDTYSASFSSEWSSISDARNAGMAHFRCAR